MTENSLHKTWKKHNIQWKQLYSYSAKEQQSNNDRLFGILTQLITELKMVKGEQSQCKNEHFSSWYRPAYKESFFSLNLLHFVRSICFFQEMFEIWFTAYYVKLMRQKWYEIYKNKICQVPFYTGLNKVIVK